MMGGEERLTEVPGHDLFGIADGSKVDAGVPVNEHIDVRRYTFVQCTAFAERCAIGFQKGSE